MIPYYRLPKRALSRRGLKLRIDVVLYFGPSRGYPYQAESAAKRGQLRTHCCTVPFASMFLFLLIVRYEETPGLETLGVSLGEFRTRPGHGVLYGLLFVSLHLSSISPFDVTASSFASSGHANLWPTSMASLMVKGWTIRGALTSQL